MKTLDRFKFIGHALNGDGPFRPVPAGSTGTSSQSGASYLVKYPRESTDKFNRRNELAFYASPLARVVSSFVAHISGRPVLRDADAHELLQRIMEDVDGKGNSIDVFWQSFMYEFKARGSMLLLVDMPQVLPDNLQQQLQERAAPYWTPVVPELLQEFKVGADGRFDFAEFTGTYDNNGEETKCIWYFDREIWACKGEDGTVIQSDAHGLDECPLLIVTEAGDFPAYGPFAPIADLSRRLFNLDSELDEILRSQTFSLLTMQVPEESTDEQRLEAARTAGETIGTNNIMMHGGGTPAFIAPDSGPASIYMERMEGLRDQINELGLMVATPNQQESGIAMQTRFQAINAELARFSARMEGLEARAWELSGQWLAMDAAPEASWPRDFNIADPEQELEILRNMQETAMPAEVIVEQQKRVVVTQFTGADLERQDELVTSLENGRSEITEQNPDDTSDG